MIRKIVSTLFKVARGANKVRIAGATVKGNLHPYFRYLENRAFWRLMDKIRR